MERQQHWAGGTAQHAAAHALELGASDSEAIWKLTDLTEMAVAVPQGVARMIQKIPAGDWPRQLGPPHKTLDHVLVLRSTIQVWAWPGESRVAQDIVWASAVFTLEPGTDVEEVQRDIRYVLSGWRRRPG